MRVTDARIKQGGRMKKIVKVAKQDLMRRIKTCKMAKKKAVSEQDKHGKAYWKMEQAKAEYRLMKIEERFAA